MSYFHRSAHIFSKIKRQLYQIISNLQHNDFSDTTVCLLIIPCKVMTNRNLM